MKISSLVKHVMRVNIEDIEQLREALLSREFDLGICRFSTGKVYKVTRKDTAVVAYVGSTIRKLPHRWTGHLTTFVNQPNLKWSLYVKSNGGPGNFQISLIEDYPCKTFTELQDREKHFINLLKPLCNSNLVDSSEEEPTRQRVKKRAEFSYDELNILSSAEESAFMSSPSSQIRDQLMLARLRKHLFVKITRNLEIKVASDIFEYIQQDSKHFLTFLQLHFCRVRFVQDDMHRLCHVSTTLCPKEFPYIPITAMDEIVSLLGLTSFTDRETMLHSSLVEVKAEKLMALSTKFRSVIGMKIKSKDTNIRNVIANLNACFRNVGLHFEVVEQNQERVRGERKWKTVWRLTPFDKFSVLLYSHWD